jgi:vacuolar-type H+-ATPase subunit H
MLKKILIVAGILLVLIVGAAVLLPIIYKDKIVALVKEEVNKNINAKVDFGDFDLTILSSFPDFTIKIDQLSVIGIAPFEGDTLTSAKQLALTVDIMSVIKGSQIDIESIELNQAFINLIVLKDGRANWDIAKADSSKSAEEPAAPSKFNVALKSYEINESRISYDDASLGFTMTMDDFTHQGMGDFTQDLFILSTNTNATATNLWYGGVKYMHQVRTNLKADLDMDMQNMKFTFKENELQLNELFIGLDGWLSMPKEDINMDLNISARQNDFRNFLSMIPGVYKEGFKDLKSGGTLELKAFVKGTYNEQKMPGFGLNLKVVNGQFQYPSLPVAVNNVQLDLQVNNPDGVPDHTTIDLKRLHVELGKEPFDAKLSVRTPVSDANINATVKGSVNFANLSKIVPLEQGTTIRGTMNADLSMAGRMSAIEQQRYEEFNAGGSIVLNNFNYSSKDYQQGFDLKECRLTFNPQHIELNNFDARMGKSDIQANGKLDNLLAYFFKKEILKGSLNLMSNNLDLSEFNTQDGATPAAAKDTSAMTLIEVPGNLDFTVNASVGKLSYDNVILDNLSGKVVIRDQAMNMENLSFTTLSGVMKLSGMYATRERKKADIALNMDISGFDIQQTVKTFNTVKKMAPIAERANGRFSSNFTMNGKLDEHMQPDLKTLTGGGKLSTANVTISNFGPMLKIAEVLKMDQFKELDVSNVNISFSFVNGRVDVKPFDVTLAGIPTTVSGSTGFDQTIDYNLAMNAPVSKLPSAATGVITGLISKANAKGANFSMAENIKLNLKLGGTVSNPTVSTDLKETSGKAIDQIKDKIKEEFDSKKKELEDKAKAEADRLKKEAEDKAKAEVDKLKKEAEEKARQEKEKLKKEAEKKAKDALKNVFGPK